MMPDWFNNYVGPIMLTVMMLACAVAVVALVVWMIKTWR